MSTRITLGGGRVRDATVTWLTTSWSLVPVTPYDGVVFNASRTCRYRFVYFAVRHTGSSYNERS